MAAPLIPVSDNVQGMNILFHVLLDPGDEVTLTDPGFASHVQQLRLCGARPRFWRLGYMVLPGALKQQVLKVQDANIICAPHVSQVAGLAALGSTEQPWPEFTRILDARRSRTCARLDRMPHVFDYVRPQGAYYVFPRIVAPHADSREFALRLLDQARATVTPGAGFGPSGEHHVRIAYCVSEDDIDAGFDRIEARFGRGG